MLNKIILDERSRDRFVCSKSGPVGRVQGTCEANAGPLRHLSACGFLPVGRVQGKPVRQMQVPYGTFLPVTYLTGFAFIAGTGKNAYCNNLSMCV